MKVAIIDCGINNIASIRRAVEDLGIDARLAEAPADLQGADKLVLPGVGAFGGAMQALRERGLDDALRTAVLVEGKALLGICLGMQLLATRSFEGGLEEGLGLIPGEVRRLDTLGCTLRIPHVGWNEVRLRSDDPLFEGIPDGSDFYFVHSYGFVPDGADRVLAVSPYGCEVTAVVRNGNIYGCQFHPEKSSRAGRLLLKNFMSQVLC
jgi:glutamine amidotransferase